MQITTRNASYLLFLMRHIVYHELPASSQFFKVLMYTTNNRLKLEPQVRSFEEIKS